MLELMPTIQTYLKGNPPLVVSTGNASLGLWAAKNNFYKRDWHSNELTGKNSPFGIFAGFVNVAPNVPLYSTPLAWDEFVDYMNTHSRRLNEMPSSAWETNYRASKYIKDPFQVIEKKNLNAYKEERLKNKVSPYKERILQRIAAQEANVLFRFSDNNKSPHLIGRDEQLYLFLLMPKALDNLFIFKQDLGDESPPKLDLDYHERLIREYKAAVERNFAPVPVNAAPSKGVGWGGRRKTRRNLSKPSKRTRKH